MGTTPERSDDFAYLLPLFEAVRPYRADGYFVPLPEPAVRSSLTADDGPLKSWGSNPLIRTSFSAGLFHVDALCSLVSVAGRVDPNSPWTLLRGALENFATAVWLLSGKDRNERRGRALALWAEDMRNRAQHEEDIQYVVTGEGKSGQQRRRDILLLGANLNLTPLPAAQAGAVIADAAEAAGMDSASVRASWRVASGFAHGRFWPNLRAAQPRGAIPTASGYLVAIVIDDAELKRLADACLRLLHHAARLYQARNTAS